MGSGLLCYLLSFMHLRKVLNIRSWHGSLLAFSHEAVSYSVTPWTAAHQAFLSFTVSWSLLRFMSVESVTPSNHLILCCPLLLLPSIFSCTGSFQMSQLFTSGGQSIGVSAPASVLPMNVQGWFPLGLGLGLISLLTEGLSRMFSSTTVQKHQFFSAQPFLWSSSHIRTWLLEKP